jgi:hypothetical protein
VRLVSGDVRLEILMPDLTVVSPSAVVPADRLTLGATDARAWPQYDLPTPLPTRFCSCDVPMCNCMAEE